MVLRDRQDYREMEKQCREILRLDEDVYWAIFYLQEACEQLGKDQEVVDAFLEMLDEMGEEKAMEKYGTGKAVEEEGENE